ncbi:hypothetical protein D3C78_1240110 [compost metagenome]
MEEIVIKFRIPVQIHEACIGRVGIHAAVVVAKAPDSMSSYTRIGIESRPVVMTFTIKTFLTQDEGVEHVGFA